jgi:geranylgeranyl reductase family protein
MKTHYDVIVAGLGPAGATAAYTLAKSGLSVLALDKAKFPRMKPCGGGITAKGIRATDIDWSSCVEFQAHRVKLVCRHQFPLKFVSATPLIYMVSRPTFDHFLVKQAEKQGVAIRQNERIKTVKQDQEKVTVVTEKQTYTSNYLVGGDGALGIVRRQILNEENKRNIYVAAETESCPMDRGVDTADEEIYFHLGSVPSGYGWVFGKRIHQSVGVYGTTRKMRNPVHRYREFVDGYAKQINGNSVPVRVHPVPVYTSKSHTVARGRVLLVGDAAGLVDPLLGEGIYYALYSGRIAGEIISQNRDSTHNIAELYQHRIDEEIGKELAIAEKLANLIYSFPSLSFKLFQAYPKIFSDFCRVLAGTQTYQGFTRELKEELLIRKPLLSRFLLGTNRFRVLLSND